MQRRRPGGEPDTKVVFGTLRIAGGSGAAAGSDGAAVVLGAGMNERASKVTSGSSITPAGAELDASIALIRSQYDCLPYRSLSFPNTHPCLAAATAALFGLDAVPLDRARVLELGCSSGGNIIPLAVRHPDAKFVAVDLSAVQIEEGRRRASRLGLANLEFIEGNILDLTFEPGSFDYVICHGVYSWVPEPVRNAILALCRRTLSENGLALISYNVLPGWRLPQIMRDAFLSLLPEDQDPLSRTREAKRLALFLKEHGLGARSFAGAAVEWADRIMAAEDSYVGHEFLELNNAPCTFRDFVAAAAEHALCFVGEAEFFTMILDRHSPETARAIRERTGDRMIPNEQMLDVLTGRTFRHSILTRAERDPDIRRMVLPERFADLHLVVPGDTRIEPFENGIRMTNARGWIRIDDEATAAMAQRIIDRFPASSCAADIASSASPVERMRALNLMRSMTFFGVALPVSEPIAALAVPSARPRATFLARNDAAHGASWTTNLRHEHVGLGDSERFLLPLLDGTNDVAALVDAAMSAVRAGRLRLSDDDAATADPSPDTAAVDRQIRALLRRSAGSAFLEA